MNQIYLSDIPRILTGVAEWCGCLFFISIRPKRFIGFRLWLIGGAWLLIQCLFLQLTDNLMIALWVPCMLGAIGLMFVFIIICCDITLLSAIYFTICSFMAAEFTASLAWQLYSYARHVLELGTGFWCELLQPLMFLAVVCVISFSLLYWLELRREDPATALVFQIRDLWPPLIMSSFCFVMSNLSFIYANIPFTSSVLEDIYNLRTLLDFAGILMLYAYNTQRCEMYVQRELDAIQNVLNNQYAQYCQSQESIDLINRKYHDLKHQIAVLQAEQDSQRRMDFLSQMKEEIRAYEAQNKTGNSVLDTILTSKGLHCAKHGIELTCVADGAKLDFMDVMDICSIFGNILDNAIECELRIEDTAKRLIHLAVYTKQRFLIIQCENYCDEALKFQNGLPTSTKENSGYHGFGIKSIRYAAAKYDGTVTIHNQDNWFEIDIIIPFSSDSPRYSS